MAIQNRDLSLKNFSWANIRNPFFFLTKVIFTDTRGGGGKGEGKGRELSRAAASLENEK